MRWLIVNADDFGLTEKVNEAVVEAHRNGILMSASVLANGAAFDSAVKKAQQQPRLGVGLHLNVSDGRPVSDPSRIAHLVDDRRLLFVGPVQLARRLASRSIPLREVERELRAQIEKAFAAGLQPTHLDGHKHFHMWPPVFELVLRLAREYGIAGIRCAAERPCGLVQLLNRNSARASAILKQYLVARGLALVSLGYREKLRRAGLRCPRYFFGVTETGFLDAGRLTWLLSELPPGTSELMCHPGYSDAELESHSTRLRAQREKELHALTDIGVKRMVAERGIQLISYRELTLVP